MISLIVATYNRLNELKRFLNSLLPAKRIVQVIIVDQNDKLNLTLLVNEFRNIGMNIIHLKCVEKNLSSARNFGIGYATNDLIAFPDDDCYYEPDTIQNVLNIFTKIDSEIVIGNWVEKNGPLSSEVYNISKENIMSFKHGPISSITIFIRKNILDCIGGFDTRFGVGKRFGAGEETDLIMRASYHGFHVKFYSQINIHHKYIQVKNKKLTSCLNEINRQRAVGALYIKHKLKIRIVLKGLGSPLVKCLNFFNLKMVPFYICTFYGRLTGIILWTLTYSEFLKGKK